ncbi:MAG: chemotaxis protein CheW [Acidobacteria bacterium]|nr:chemotaxis protein CheW [Acidobacteriota bacterium]
MMNFGHKRLVRCSVGPETYCIDSEWLDSIQVMENLYPSRGADGAVGWIRRFDEKVPVFRLDDQIHGAGSRAAARQGVIMVIRRDDRLWALLADKVTASAEVASDRVFPLPPLVGDSASGCFPSVVVEEDGLVLYLAPDRLVPSMRKRDQGAQPRNPAFTAGTPSRVKEEAQRAPSVDADPAATLDGARRHGKQIITLSLAHERAPDVPVRFAISAGQALEIRSGLPMITVPNAPPFVVGLASWRNLPVPVVDLAKWLGLPPAPYTPGTRLLICRGTIGRHSRDAGLLAVPAVDDFRKLDLPIAYEPWPTAVPWNSSLALGIYRAERSMLVVPDLDAILSFQTQAPAYSM